MERDLSQPAAFDEQGIYRLRRRDPVAPAGFRLVSDYRPAGDQPEAIRKLTEGLLKENRRDQVLLGVTGSGKTYTMANIIANAGRPALIMAHNKTLAAQLFEEMRGFFPHNHVHYFVSYFDYYQPEAYVPRTDTYIEKDSDINEQIDRMRHAATRGLLEHNDVIVVASVSCIYGIGGPENYSEMVLRIEVGQTVVMKSFLRTLVSLQYKRSEDFRRGTFRLKGDTLDLFPAHLENRAWRFSFFGDRLESLREFDPLTGEIFGEKPAEVIYPNSHYVVAGRTIQQAIVQIKEELQSRLAELEDQKKLLEAQRLRERATFDLEMLAATGYCSGIENYSRYLTGRPPDAPPPTLYDFLPQNALLFVDESHVTVPQIGGMFRGDRSRKQTLADYGFRLPSCVDNRPLRFEEWDHYRPQTIFVSATPAVWELDRAGGEVVEQLIRPTGLLDPVCEVRPVATQVDDLLDELKKQQQKGHRSLVTVLTKRQAEQLSEYLTDNGQKVKYMHSDVDTLERIEIIRDLRRGVFDALVGINLLREGLDIPECSLVAILDADKEGFLRSRTSLIQTIGRAARHVDGRAVLYADVMTGSLQWALEETERRRQKQKAFNEAHNITPQGITRHISDILADVSQSDYVQVPLSAAYPDIVDEKTLRARCRILEKEMLRHAADLEFEKAAKKRDELKKLEELSLSL